MNQQTREAQRVYVWVRGRVQGVGFRAFVEHNAQKLGLSGWVRNVGEDTVEAIAEGERDKLEHFVRMMQHGPRMSQVDESKVEWQAPTGEFGGFGVRASN